MNGDNEKCIQNIKKNKLLGDLGVNGRTHLKRLLKKWNERLWRIGTIVGIL
jgi:hypothetical protein